MKADVVTYCTLVLGFCRLQQFEAGIQLMDEMVELGFSPTEAAVSGLVDGLRKQGKIDDAYELVVKVGRFGFVLNLSLEAKEDSRGGVGFMADAFYSPEELVAMILG